MTKQNKHRNLPTIFYHEVSYIPIHQELKPIFQIEVLHTLNENSVCSCGFNHDQIKMKDLIWKPKGPIVEGKGEL